ncbi:MAG: biotin--[acetyl-CoA-carboxylase] ligase [Methanobrevibacter sp.]|jgi:BirA family biotin operon repressor/biotin-[acetyl-CoA-carboxylase] ligase|nr:biotin--[acetyl-CoA-carboxylase] ligase [Methanobrevibacter sp.]
MKKNMQELLSKNEEKISKNSDSILNITEEEIASTIKELGTKKTERIIVDEIKEKLNTEYIGKEIYCFQEVDSTNTVSKFLAEFGTDEGTVIIAETQTKGKGSRGKKWESPVGGIWLSIVLRPDISPSKASLITLAAGVGVANVLRDLGVDARIKWPNDVLINNKKVSGILTEANAKFSTVDYVIVGIGIDSNLNIDTLPSKIQPGTTSLKEELKEDIDESQIIANFLVEFEKIYNKFKKEEFDDILYDWRKMSQTIGSYVEIQQPLGKKLKGYAVGINRKGALILEKDNGNLIKVISGECIIKEDK